MRHTFLWIVAASLLAVGCSHGTDTTSSGSTDISGAASGSSPAVGTESANGGSSSSSGPLTGNPAAPDPAGGPQAPQTAGASPVAIVSGAATLGHENTKIEFVGTHVGPKPEPRTGGFEKFSGKVELDDATKAIKSVSVDIETASLWTQIPRLTNHLKSADFLEVAAHPTLKFVSTKIESATPAGSFVITGDLTLHGVTRPITFPATVTVSDAGLLLTAAFAIDRTEFDMSFGPDKVEKSVAITVAVGERTQPH